MWSDMSIWLMAGVREMLEFAAEQISTVQVATASFTCYSKRSTASVRMT